MDAEARFAVLSVARRHLPAKLGEEVVCLVRDVERDVFCEIRQKYGDKVREAERYADYLNLLARIVPDVERRFRRHPLIRAWGADDDANFALILALVKIQVSAHLDTLL